MNLYSFARPSSMAISQYLLGNKEPSPQKKCREAYNAIARPQEPWAQEGGRYYTNLTYSIQEVNPEKSIGEIGSSKAFSTMEEALRRSMEGTRLGA